MSGRGEVTAETLTEMDVRVWQRSVLLDCRWDLNELATRWLCGRRENGEGRRIAAAINARTPGPR